jgi:hypothetical protein
VDVVHRIDCSCFLPEDLKFHLDELNSLDESIGFSSAVEVVKLLADICETLCIILIENDLTLLYR